MLLLYEVYEILAENNLNSNLTASDNLQFKFGKDGDGNYGYYGADGSLVPFKSRIPDFTMELSSNMQTAGTSSTQYHYSYSNFENLGWSKLDVTVGSYPAQYVYINDVRYDANTSTTGIDISGIGNLDIKVMNHVNSTSKGSVTLHFYN